MEICKSELCTGCGMCSNICPTNAISMQKKEHGFIYPVVNTELCVNCGLCYNKCPANKDVEPGDTVQRIFAAWNKDKKIRKKSTSGGIFTLLALKILHAGGAVAGVKWNHEFKAMHCIIDTPNELYLLNGSKYVQSDTNTIYHDIKCKLEKGISILFSGTPCQNHALQLYLGKDYTNLFQVDLVCHGVPPQDMLDKYLKELKRIIKYDAVSDIRLRYKDPYWDYCKVRIDFSDKPYYAKFTVDDPYFTLFNIGYSLRERCHTCKYTSMHRYGDITLADFWGYTPHNFKMRDYNKGISLVMLNSKKGIDLFDSVKHNLNLEESTYKKALTSNKSLYEPFSLPNDRLIDFWNDYENGWGFEDLRKKYVPKPFCIPNLLYLRRLKKKYGWIIKNGLFKK